MNDENESLENKKVNIFKLIFNFFKENKIILYFLILLILLIISYSVIKKNTDSRSQAAELSGTDKYCTLPYPTGAGGECQQPNPGTPLVIGSSCRVNDKVGTYKRGLCTGGSDRLCCVPVQTLCKAKGQRCLIPGSQSNCCSGLTCNTTGVTGEYICGGSSCLTAGQVGCLALEVQSNCCTGLICKYRSTGEKACGARGCTDYTGSGCGINGRCVTSPSCGVLPIGASCIVPGTNKPGTYKSGYCPGGTETRCCVPN